MLDYIADDLHCCETFQNEHELHAAIQRIWVLLDILELLMGMKLSLAKSHALINICGTNSRKVLQKIVHVDATGPYIEIPRANNSMSRLPVKTSAKYVGVILSYQRFESLTVETRLQAARTTFTRLRRWLCSKQIPLTYRLQMWKACVFATMVYGIFATGFTMSDVLQIQQCIFGMYRQMTGDHSFLTRHTHLQILQQYHLDHPLPLLLHAGCQLRETVSRRLTSLTSQDIIWTIDWTHLPQLLQLINVIWTEQVQVQMTMPADEVRLATFPCHFCHATFSSLPNLHRHQTHVHGHTQLRSHMAASFAVGGLPQCSHCNESFPSWRIFPESV
jgi:hypothetical protein